MSLFGDSKAEPRLSLRVPCQLFIHHLKEFLVCRLVRNFAAPQILQVSIFSEKDSSWLLRSPEYSNADRVMDCFRPSAAFFKQSSIFSTSCLSAEE